MTTATLPPAAPLLRPAPSRGVAQRFADVLVLTGRNLVHIAREPLQLSDVTIQPVLFTLLFVYVFGSGVVLPGGGPTPASWRSSAASPCSCSSATPCPGAAAASAS